MDCKGEIKIADYGLAKCTTGTKGIYDICGTLPYISPEVFRKKEATPASDIWSLGIVSYELLQGTRPFVG